jgi:hypothetical protein
MSSAKSKFVILHIGILLAACANTAATSTWFVGTFESAISTSALSKKMTVTCSSEVACQSSVTSTSLSSKQPIPVNSDEANRALIYTRTTYMSNRKFFNDKYSADVKLIDLLDKNAASVGNCVDIGPKNINGLFIFCSSASDPKAQTGGVLFTSTLFSPSIGRKGDPQLYGKYYIMYLERK